MNIQKPQKILFEINKIEKAEKLEEEVKKSEGKITNKLIENQEVEELELYDIDFKVVKFNKCNIHLYIV